VVARRAGPNFDDLEIQTLVGFVHFTDDLRGSPRRWRELRVTPDDALNAPVTLVGTETQIVELSTRVASVGR